MSHNILHESGNFGNRLSSLSAELEEYKLNNKREMELMASPMNTRKYRCALIGCGGISRSHMEFYPGWDVAELTACADPFPDARERVAGAVPGCRPFADYNDLLSNMEDLDLVVIATRPNLHHPITLAAANSGVRAVLCEKPMARDLGQALEMQEVCAKQGTRLVIGHQRRYDPQYAAARRILQEGGIGEILGAEAWWPCSRKAYLGGHKLAVEGGGVVMYLGIHIFDMLHFLIGDTQSVFCRVTKKIAESDIEDGAACHLLLENGRNAWVNLGEVIYDMAGVSPEVSWLRFFLTGTKGSMAFGDYSLSAWWRTEGHKEWKPVKPSEEYLGGTGFRRLHEAIYTSLEHGQPTLCDVETAIQAQRVAMACYESARTGVPVETARVRHDSPLAAMNREWSGEAWTIGGPPEY